MKVILNIDNKYDRVYYINGSKVLIPTKVVRIKNKVCIKVPNIRFRLI
jgi:hypothetical protein